MNAIAQALHVARKDFRAVRWMLLAYLALMLLAALRAVGLLGADATGALDAAAPLMILVGLVLAANIMQTDSPTPTAFWATRPLAPGSMTAGKLVVALLVLLPAIAMQAYLLRLFDVPAADAIASALQSGARFGGWLLLAVLLGSVAKSFKQFVLIGVAAFVLFLLPLPLLSVLPSDADTRIFVSRWLLVAGVALTVATVYALYRYRDPGWRMWPAVVLSFTMLVHGLRWLPSMESAAASDWSPRTAKPASLPLSHAMRLTADSVGMNGVLVRVRLTVRPLDASFRGRVRMRDVMTRLERNGAEARALEQQAAVGARVVFSSTSSSTGGQNRHSQVVEVGDDAPWTIREVAIGADEWIAVRETRARFAFAALVEEFIPDGVDTLSLQAARWDAPGRSVSYVQRVTQDSVGLHLNVVRSLIGAQLLYERLVHSEVPRAFVLVNDSLQERHPLPASGTSFDSEMLILPGARFGRVTELLVLRPDNDARRRAMTKAWLRNAHVEVDRWKVARRYDVALTSDAAR